MVWFARHRVVLTGLGVFGLLIFAGACGPADRGGEAASQSERQQSTTATRTDPAPTREHRKKPRTTKARKTVGDRPTASPQPKHARPDRRLYAVLDVVDGDTVEAAYRGGESVRVIGIDTPETVHPSVPDECGGAAASAAAERILGGKSVALVFDRSQGRRDAYGRLLAYLQVPGTGDFGLTMIKRGLAAEYTYDIAYERQTRYQRAEARAQAADKAMWGKCGGPDTPAKQPGSQAEPKQPPGGRCEPGYDPCVPPYPPDVDCSDVDGPIRVTGSDPHGLDADGDGSACES
jgi:endonuclease YncB( thermonuclease family)